MVFATESTSSDVKKWRELRGLEETGVAHSHSYLAYLNLERETTCIYPHFI